MPTFPAVEANKIFPAVPVRYILKLASPDVDHGCIVQVTGVTARFVNAIRGLLGFVAESEFPEI